jgi:hypothetical protein
MSMGKGVKIALGCLVALLVLCIIAAVVGFFAMRAGWNLFGGAAKDAMAIQKLDTDYAYTEPSDGVVTESRLQAYIAVCAKVKPEVDKLQALGESKKGKEKGSWSDARDAMKYTTGVITAMRKGLEEQKMSPREFHFIGNAMRTASFETPEGSGGQTLDSAQRQMKEMMVKNLEGLLANPSLPPEQKTEIQSQLDTIKKELNESAPGSPNAALYAKFRDKLKQVDLQGLEGVAFQQGQTGGTAEKDK